MAKTLLQLAGATPMPSRLGQSTLVLIDIQNEYFDGPVKLTGVEAAAGVAAGLLARARALVLPSVDASETFGLVQLEAMAAGVPVIASDLATGVREVGEPGRTCLLVPPGEAQALAEAMGSLHLARAFRARLTMNRPSPIRLWGPAFGERGT